MEAPDSVCLHRCPHCKEKKFRSPAAVANHLKACSLTAIPPPRKKRKVSSALPPLTEREPHGEREIVPMASEDRCDSAARVEEPQTLPASTPEGHEVENEAEVDNPSGNGGEEGSGLGEEDESIVQDQVLGDESENRDDGEHEEEFEDHENGDEEAERIGEDGDEDRDEGVEGSGDEGGAPDPGDSDSSDDGDDSEGSDSDGESDGSETDNDAMIDAEEADFEDEPEVVFSLDEPVSMSTLFPLERRESLPVAIELNERRADFQEARQSNQFHPFASLHDLQMGIWIVQSKVSESAANEMLSFQAMKEKLSFNSYAQLKNILKQVPHTPWKEESVPISFDHQPRDMRFYYRDAWEIMKDLFSDDRLAGKMAYHFTPLTKNHRRSYGVFSGGLYFEHLQTHIPPGATPLVYRVYSDATQLIFNGELSYHPMFLTLLNISSETRKLPWCHKLVGLIPRLTASKAEKKKKWFHQAKIALFQGCYDKVLASTLPYSSSGCKIQDPKGQLRAVFPFYGYSSSDWTESKYITLTKDGNRTQEPCGCCRCPKDHLDKLAQFFPLRTTKGMKSIYEAAKLKRTKKAAKELCDAASLTFVENKLWKYCNPYVSRVPDILHHMNLGLLKKAIKYSLKSLRAMNGGDEMVSKLEKAVCSVGIRDLKTFKAGILDMAGLKGWEYVDLCFLMIHALYEVKAPDNLTKLFIALADTVIALRIGVFNVDDLRDLLTKQEDLQAAFETSGLAEVCKSQLKFVKMHDITHHILSIMLYEDPSSYSTEVGELLNRLRVKSVYARGNHHEDHSFIFRKEEEGACAEYLKTLLHPSLPKKWKRGHFFTIGKTVSVREVEKWKARRTRAFEMLPRMLKDYFPQHPPRKIAICSTLWISDTFKRQRVLANEKFHSKEVFSFVQVANDEDDDWIALVLVLFTAHSRNLCLIQWLDDDDGKQPAAKRPSRRAPNAAIKEDVTGMRRLMLLDHFQIIDSKTIQAEVPVSLIKGQDRFHLDHRVFAYRNRK